MGALSFAPTRTDAAAGAGAMLAALAARGPDGEGLWADPDAGIMLGHRRLAIVDLSPAGAQPMASADGRWMLCWNGEIYNHRALRARLEREGRRPAGGWHGHSDSETLVEAIAAWGLEPALRAAQGMFAIALWDRRERRLWLARDRFGEKPLYYARAGGRLIFASTPAALLADPALPRRIDADSAALLLRGGVVPAPRTILTDMHQLPPGSIADISADAVPPTDALAGRRWWHWREERAEASPLHDLDAAVAALGHALDGAVADMREADVPVGLFLSGGIDSSLVAARAMRVAAQPVNSFAIGFAEAGYDEAPHAEAIAAHLGTDHRTYRFHADEALDLVGLLPVAWPEPFADSSALATLLLAREARGAVTVALTGDGGDEMFAGYRRHLLAPRAWRGLRRVPGPLRRLAGTLPDALLARLTGGGPGAAEKRARLRRRLAEVRDFDSLYASLFDEWPDAEPVRASRARPGWHDAAAEPTALRRALALDIAAYLPDDILVKVDRAGMAVGLEARMPFLHPAVAAVAARLDERLLVQDGVGKIVPRALLAQSVPRRLFERPKAGFAVPVDRWLRGPLRSWAEGLLAPDALAADGLLDAAPIRARWQAHLAGTTDAAAALWPVLMLQQWRAHHGV